MAAEGQFGKMVSLRPDGMMGQVPLKEAVNKIRCVDPKGELVLTAKALGISFGD